MFFVLMNTPIVIQKMYYTEQSLNCILKSKNFLIFLSKSLMTEKENLKYDPYIF